MLFCDLDEVIFPFIEPCCRLLKERHNILVLPEQANTFDWFEIPGAGITRELWYDILNGWSYDHDPFPGAVEFTHALAGIDDICYITARPERCRPQTEKQLLQLAKGELVMVGKSKYKLDIIKAKRRNSAIIDDHPTTVVDCAEAGIRSYVFHRPVNLDVNHPGVTRVYTYDEIIMKERDARK